MFFLSYGSQLIVDIQYSYYNFLDSEFIIRAGTIFQEKLQVK